MNPEYELILSKLDGMDQRNDARFNAQQREQDGIVSWLERLTAMLEKTLVLEERLSASDKIQAEMKTEQVAIKADLQNIKTAHAVSSWRLGATVSAFTLAAGAGIAAVADKIFK